MKWRKTHNLIPQLTAGSFVYSFDSDCFYLDGLINGSLGALGEVGRGCKRPGPAGGYGLLRWYLLCTSCEGAPGIRDHRITEQFRCGCEE